MSFLGAAISIEVRVSKSNGPQIGTQAPPSASGTAMPPHLHPRSGWTTSLFTTTLLASFFVVGMPHILPCPAPRTDLADAGTLGDGQRRRRRKRPTTEATDVGTIEATPEELVGEGALMARKARECPVPKPSGLIGEVLGFKQEDKAQPLPPIRLETRRPQLKPSRGG
ncbi:MAG: hypothetical protein M1830_001090 [Pleopsidium flavum]|nr:MAG: hypothetical protein M1830_001090 [Pleopsidium flavum]